MVNRKLLLLVVLYTEKIMSEIISKKEIEHFVLNGFVRIDNAFSQEIADVALDILWNDLPCDRSDPSTWTEPVIRLGMYTQPPFIESVNTSKLHAAFNRLIGFNNGLLVQVSEHFLSGFLWISNRTIQVNM